MASWTTTEFSLEQEVALSKVLLAESLRAASPGSAVSSTMPTAFPAPTPKEGVPLE